MGGIFVCQSSKFRADLVCMLILFILCNILKARNMADLRLTPFSASTYVMYNALSQFINSFPLVATFIDC